MNRQDKLIQLQRITQARYDQEQQRLRKLLAEEHHLRHELARLDAALQASHTDPLGKDEMRAIGADVLWQGWVGRSKSALNLQLAQVLARKEHHVKQVRKAFGKTLVARDLRKKSQKQSDERKARFALNRAMEHSLFN